MRTTSHGRLTLSLRKFHTTWDRGRRRPPALRRRLALCRSAERETGQAPLPYRIADRLRMREACESERG